MNNIRTLKGGVNLNGKVKVPGDKSISHRALIIGSIAKGETTIEGFLHSEDPLSTADCLRKLGVKVDEFLFLAIEKTAPFCVGVYRADKEMLEEGDKKVEEALNIIQQCNLDYLLNLFIGLVLFCKAYVKIFGRKKS